MWISAAKITAASRPILYDFNVTRGLERVPYRAFLHECCRHPKKGETITITEEDGPTTTARLIDVSQVVLMGNVRMTTPCLHELMRREISCTAAPVPR